jgi:hypothetical protein
MSPRFLWFPFVASMAASAVWGVACSNSNNPSENPDSGQPPPVEAGGQDSPTPPGDSGPADSCPGTSTPDCYPTPLPPDASHEMIINACTDAQAFNKTPTLPLLGPCGALPPLP